MAKHLDYYSIVIAGEMNPAIHHPAWYQRLGLVSDADLQHAIASEGFVCTPVVAQFDLPSMGVVCHPDRWEIATQDPDELVRALSIAIAVYEALPHTPIEGFAFDFSFHRTTRLARVGRFLALGVESMNIGLPCDDSSVASIHTRTRHGERQVRVIVAECAGDPDTVTFDYDVRYDVLPDARADLAVAMRRRFVVDRDEASSELTRVLLAIDQHGENR